MPPNLVSDGPRTLCALSDSSLFKWSLAAQPQRSELWTTGVGQEEEVSKGSHWMRHWNWILKDV